MVKINGEELNIAGKTVAEDAREYPGGLLRLDPAFAYAEPPSS